VKDRLGATATPDSGACVSPGTMQQPGALSPSMFDSWCICATYYACKDGDVSKNETCNPNAPRDRYNPAEVSAECAGAGGLGG
jgi:hypothetical protein